MRVKCNGSRLNATNRGQMQRIRAMQSGSSKEPGASMRGIIVLGIGGLLGPDFGGSFAGEDGKAGFPFPPDKAGQLLKQLLQPAARSTSENTHGQIRFAGFAAVERPEVPLAVFQGDPP